MTSRRLWSGGESGSRKLERRDGKLCQVVGWAAKMGGEWNYIKAQLAWGEGSGSGKQEAGWEVERGMENSTKS